MASFCGWRSGSIVSSSRAEARPRSTRSSFQARLAASRRPEHSPWPRNGGVRCAASPTSSTRRSRIRSASIERNSYTALRVSGPSCGRYHGSSSAHTRSGSLKSDACSSGSSMNSHRRCRGPLCTIVVGRDGSHCWLAIGRCSRAAMSFGSASTTSHRSRKPRSRRPIPLASRTNELAPSAPTSQREVTVRVSPVSASLPGSSSVTRRSVSSICSSDWTSPSAVHPRSP